MQMKRIIFISILLLAAICSNAQEAGKIVLVKVYEVHPSILNCDASIKIINTDNTIETIPLKDLNKANIANQDENDKKIRDALDKVISKGFEIKTSNQLSYAVGIMITTYVFEKK